jgi:hypothetical protein
VEFMIQMFASGLLAAVTLDPTLDVDAAVHMLRSGQLPVQR